ncbi:MAG TPA: hypothetical protein VGK27_01735 [Candidatus Deferrimicrobiaceae bacterium]|jgi:hypothetical protein
MRNVRPFSVSTVLVSLIAGMSLLASGCACMRHKGAACDNAAKAAKHGKGELPTEIGVTLHLEEGNSWKGRFVSTGEVRRTLRAADGKETVRNRSLGLELTAVQTVKSVKDGIARIEIRESAAKILQDGKFVDAPFRRLSPPETFYFTLDTNTGKADCTEMAKAWRDWMATVKDSPAGDILGKTFRLEGYLAQMQDLYTKPFTRLAGRKLTREYRAIEEKDFLLPFVGPSVDLGPMQVKTELAYEGFEVSHGKHFLNAAGKYAGESRLSPELLTERLEDFGVKLPGQYTSKTSAAGNFRSAVDIISGREIQTDSRVTYTATASFDGATLSEEIAAKFLLVPED